MHIDWNDVKINIGISRLERDQHLCQQLQINKWKKIKIKLSGIANRLERYQN